MALRSERRHDWEKRLTEDQEEKLIAALAAYKKAGHDLDVYHEGGKLDVYDPPIVASLYALTDAFHKGTDVAKFLAGNDGVLQLSREPNAGNLVRHIETVLESARAEVDGLEHSTTDEVRGVLELGVKAGGAMNLVAVDLARVAERVKKEREDNERAPMGTIVRDALKSAIASGEGALWMRSPTAEEQSLARRVVDR
jgi:hypothetical protein